MACKNITRNDLDYIVSRVEAMYEEARKDQAEAFDALMDGGIDRNRWLMREMEAAGVRSACSQILGMLDAI